MFENHIDHQNLAPDVRYTRKTTERHTSQRDEQTFRLDRQLCGGLRCFKSILHQKKENDVSSLQSPDWIPVIGPSLTAKSKVNKRAYSYPPSDQIPSITVTEKISHGSGFQATTLQIDGSYSRQRRGASRIQSGD